MTSVRIFFPRIPSDHEDFLKFVSGWSSTHSAKVAKNKDGTPFCILPINYNDTKGKSGNDIIDALTGKVVGDVTLKPRLYVEHNLRKEISDIKPLKEDPDDVVNVTHYYKDFYYVQLLSEKDKNKIIREYMSTLYDECRSNMLTLLDYDELSIGGLYASMYRNESHLFRIKVLDKLEDEQIKVLFVDYGNTEFIHDKPVLEISEKIAAIPHLAHKCSIDGVCIIDPKKHDLVSIEVLNRNYKAKITRSLNDQNIECMSVDFLDFASVTFRNFLINEGIAMENEVTKTTSSSPENNEPKSIPSMKIQQNGVKEKVDQVVVTHMDSLKEFYVQLANKTVEADLLSISSKIEYLTSTFKDDLKFVNEDILYLSKFSADNNWYRCKVIDNKFNDKDPYCMVQFIDFGNKEKKSNPKDLIPLTLDWNEQAVELAAITPCTMKCAFSKSLIKGLTTAKIGRSFFRKEFIESEKIIKIVYNRSKEDDKCWIVDNVCMDGEMDFMGKYCSDSNGDKEVEAATDYYRLSNIESIAKIWFQLVRTKDRARDRDLKTIRDWSVTRIPNGIKTVTSVTLGKMYCAVNKHNQLFRCRVTCRNVDHAMVQFVDTGIYDIVKICHLYPLPASISSVRPIAESYRLMMKAKDESKEGELERKLIDILDNGDVILDLVADTTENVVRDVIVDGKRVVEGLVAQGLVEDNNCGVGESDEVGIDFSVPSVDRMGEVPNLVAMENGRAQVLRRLWPVIEDEERGSIFDDIKAVVVQCGHLEPVLRSCGEVADIEAELVTLKTDFGEVLLDRKAKMRDLQSLVDQRTVLCGHIIESYERLRVTLAELLSKEVLDELLLVVERCQRAVGNVIRVMGFAGVVGDGADHRGGGDGGGDLEETLAVVTSYKASKTYEERASQWSVLARASDEAKKRLTSQVALMVREYEACDGAVVMDEDSAVSVSLVDTTYELHECLRREVAQYVAVKDDVDLALVLTACQRYLHTQMAALNNIVSSTTKYESLHQYATSLLQDDVSVTLAIEDSHKRILASRSALRHAVPDLEDAEELDLDQDRQHELQGKIHDLRLTLQRELRLSDELLSDDNKRKLMLMKPELQLKNQSILLNEDAVPIFLWDPIYFDMSQESSSDSYISSLFEDQTVKMKKMAVCGDEYKSLLGNYIVYSSLCHVTPDSVTDTESTSKVTLMSARYAFLSKCGNAALYVIVPDFVAIKDTLPGYITQSLVSVVTFFRDVINHIVTFWHLGFIYSDDDLRSGLFLSVSSESHRPVDAPPLCLPLPVTSIVNRENLSTSVTCQDSQSSINVYMRKLGALFLQTVEACIEGGEVDDGDKDYETLKYLVCVVTNCSDVAEAETVCDDLGQYVTRRMHAQMEAANARLLRESSPTVTHYDNGTAGIVGVTEDGDGNEDDFHDVADSDDVVASDSDLVKTKAAEISVEEESLLDEEFTDVQ